MGTGGLQPTPGYHVSVWIGLATGLASSLRLWARGRRLAAILSFLPISWLGGAGAAFLLGLIGIRTYEDSPEQRRAC
jgi:hypothetical protein